MLTRLTALLLLVEFLDEVVSGIPALGAPQIQQGFGVSYGQAAGWLIFAFGLGGLAEAPVLLLAEGRARGRFVRGGLFALGALSLAAAFAPSYPLLFVTLACWGLASGVGVSLSQATLMDVHPERRERMLTRWVLLGELGDLTTPVLLAGLALVALGWRSAFALGGALFVVAALALPATIPRGRTEHEHAQLRWRGALRDALGAPRLWFWLAGAMLCSLLDEIFVAFGSLYLRDGLGAGVAQRSLVFACSAAGGMVGLALQDRLLERFSAPRLLVAEAVLTAAVLVAWIEAPSVPLSAALAVALGASCAGLYPLAQARAYAALPGRGATVAAMASAFGWLELGVPALLALVADLLGLRVVLWLLLAQPLGVLALLAVDRRMTRREAGEGHSR